MSRALVEQSSARIEGPAGVNGNRVVFRHAVPERMPDGSPLPRRYLVVRSNLGEDEASNFGDKADTRSPVVWVTSVASGIEQQAADEAMWGAEKARDALIGWRPAIGSQRWKPVHVSSQPVTRDDDRPDVTTLFAVDTYGFQYQP